MYLDGPVAGLVGPVVGLDGAGGLEGAVGLDKGAGGFDGLTPAWGERGEEIGSFNLIALVKISRYRLLY